MNNIKLMVFDCDGVLTDGSIIYDEAGGQIKAFHARDGFGFRACRHVGMKIAVLTARSSPAVDRRMKELQVDHYLHGCDGKAAGLATILEQSGMTAKQTAYLGDDVLDLPALKQVGYPMAVADAARDVKEIAQYVTTAVGGRGAAREAIEHVLRAQGQWDAVLARFGG